MWRNKRKPDAQGEGVIVSNEDKAFKICKQNNDLFPEFEHWYETTENNEDDGTRN
jgi:hypothetical protein